MMEPTDTLAAGGKTSDGDSDASDQDDETAEVDDEEGPAETTPSQSSVKSIPIEVRAVIYEGVDEQAAQQFMTIATDELVLQEVDEQGHDLPSQVAGRASYWTGICTQNSKHTHMEACTFTITDQLADSYITTAALRRSGFHPYAQDGGERCVGEGE